MTRSILFFKQYFSNIKDKLFSVDYIQLDIAISALKKAHQLKKKIILVGNGGSASIASHLTVDLANAVEIRAINFNDPGIITCFSNDYGYKNWVKKALECYADAGDVVILISSSGQSENMLIAANKARSMDVNIITLSGFSSDNPLRRLGDVNFWVDSNVYNIVEMTHHIWLLAICDYIIEENKRIKE